MLPSNIIAVLLTVLTTARVHAVDDHSPPPSLPRVPVPMRELFHPDDRGEVPVGRFFDVPDWSHPSWTNQEPAPPPAWTRPMPVQRVANRMEQALPVPGRYAIQHGRSVNVPTWTPSGSSERDFGLDDTATSPAPGAAGSSSQSRIDPAQHPAAQSGHREAFHTLEGKPLTWEPIKADASSSTGPSETRHHIPRFMQSGTGQIWGPYPLGEGKFVMQSYPLEIPLFQHFYRDNLSPVNFEKFAHHEDEGSSADELAGAKRIDSSGIYYRPDPAVLRAVQETYWQHLRQGEIQPQKVTSSDVMEGEYLWPPVHVPDDGEGANLIFPPKVLSERYRNSITRRLREEKEGAPGRFHLETEVNGRVRHILMLSGKGGSHVLHRRWSLQDDSQLWLLYEGMVAPTHVRGQPQRFAFLGATFLPKKAKEYLQSAGVLKLAFPGVTKAPH